MRHSPIFGNLAVPVESSHCSLGLSCNGLASYLPWFRTTDISVTEATNAVTVFSQARGDTLAIFMHAFLLDKL